MTAQAVLSLPDLIAARDAGWINNTEFARLARRDHRAQYDVRNAARAQATRARLLSQKVASFTRTQRRYSTEQLTIDATGANGSVRERYAEILLQLPDVESRLAAEAEAHSFMNATASAGRPSDALSTVVRRIVARSAR